MLITTVWKRDQGQKDWASSPEAQENTLLEMGLEKGLPMLGVPGAFEQERGIGSQELLACHCWVGAHLGSAGFQHAGMTCVLLTVWSTQHLL